MKHSLILHNAESSMVDLNWTVNMNQRVLFGGGAQKNLEKLASNLRQLCQATVEQKAKTHT